jgi:hypothetical protein
MTQPRPSEHDDDLESEVHEQADQETDTFPDTADELDDTTEDDDDLLRDEDESEL